MSKNNSKTFQIFKKNSKKWPGPHQDQNQSPPPPPHDTCLKLISVSRGSVANAQGTPLSPPPPCWTRHLVLRHMGLSPPSCQHPHAERPLGKWSAGSADRPPSYQGGTRTADNRRRTTPPPPPSLYGPRFIEQTMKSPRRGLLDQGAHVVCPPFWGSFAEHTPTSGIGCLTPCKIIILGHKALPQ